MLVAGDNNSNYCHKRRELVTFGAFAGNYLWFI